MDQAARKLTGLLAEKTNKIKSDDTVTNQLSSHTAKEAHTHDNGSTNIMLSISYWITISFSRANGGEKNSIILTA